MSFFKRFMPMVKASDEGDLVDPQATLRAECKEKPSVNNLFGKYQKCNDRVRSKSQTTESCTEELFEYLHALDHCVSHSLWSHLK